ncbi:hypothetical protein PR048_001857 [Dryococelus australis]|uniref:Uncharacterized protein n=1 Tax=Dryococelus australis TaxID=614101 RepID=A0ABQ9IL15_9NEOP|nr:hypothetical protein PR048_001857 [Dryococelus australis]
MQYLVGIYHAWKGSTAHCSLSFQRDRVDYGMCSRLKSIHRYPSDCRLNLSPGTTQLENIERGNAPAHTCTHFHLYPLHPEGLLIISVDVLHVSESRQDGSSDEQLYTGNESETHLPLTNPDTMEPGKDGNETFSEELFLLPEPTSTASTPCIIYKIATCYNYGESSCTRRQPWRWNYARRTVNHHSRDVKQPSATDKWSQLYCGWVGFGKPGVLEGRSVVFEVSARTLCKETLCTYPSQHTPALCHVTGRYTERNVGIIDVSTAPSQPRSSSEASWPSLKILEAPLEVLETPSQPRPASEVLEASSEALEMPSQPRPPSEAAIRGTGGAIGGVGSTIAAESSIRGDRVVIEGGGGIIAVGSIIGGVACGNTSISFSIEISGDELLEQYEIQWAEQEILTVVQSVEQVEQGVEQVLLVWCYVVQVWCHVVLVWWSIVLVQCYVVLVWCHAVLVLCYMVLVWCYVVLLWCHLVLVWYHVVLVWCQYAPNICCIISGPSSCGKMCVVMSKLEHPNGLKFENIYVFSKTIQQEKYQQLATILSLIEFPNELLTNSVFIFDDVWCERQHEIQQYFSFGRHSNVDCFYLSPSYAHIPKHNLHNNANMLIEFKMNNVNLHNFYNDHWNNPNELVDILKILIASRESGNINIQTKLFLLLKS